jgi:hypothetical protein
MQITSPNSVIININSIKFLGLNIDTTLSWKDHTCITELSSRLNKACYALRAIKPFMSTDVMKSIYYAYVHSILSYGIIFCGNSCFSDNIFRIQKRIIRVIANLKKHDSCREIFKIYKYWHFSLNIFSHFLSLLSKTEVTSYSILIFMILIHVSSKIYTYLLQI